MRFIVSSIIALFCLELWAQNTADITVAADGSGDYTTLTEAINNLPYYNYQRMTIYVKNGIYNEKIKLKQDFITIRGESRDSTIIEYAQLREDWIKNPDITGPAVINIEADDIILDNLTIRNTQPQVGPHAFAILGTGTRTVITNCNVISKGGDTVSLWNYKQGMYYHSNCYFEGCVDFVCPRGWCYIKDSEFHQLKKTATLWHAGVDNKDKKFVLQNCSFTGVDGWELGRHHYEAAFYLNNCTFGKGMADKPIYHVTYPNKPEKNRPYFWGDRYYFSGCTSVEQNYTWFADNFKNCSDKIAPKDLSPAWTFNQQWDPENKTFPYLTKVKFLNEHNILLYFSENMGITSDLTLMTSTHKELTFVQGKGRDIIQLSAPTPLDQKDFIESLRITSGCIFTNIARVNNIMLISGDSLELNILK
nr:pectinesterase family protein [uncultured Carboxylicivirga sp.]